MKITNLVLGPLQTNCYILTIENENIIIDPADNPELIMQNINGKIVGILITHYHFDHIGGLNYFRNIPIYDYKNLLEGNASISKFKFEVIKTPGHKSDSISFLFGKHLFCGDFIFKNAIGRWDLPTGNLKELQKSINKILKYDENLKIYPGHGETTTLKDEKKNLLMYLD